MDDLKSQNFIQDLKRLKPNVIHLNTLRDLLKACAAVILFRGSLFNNRFTKSFASEERAGQGCSSKLGSAFRTALKIPDSVRAQNGRLPHSRIYAITPILHTSASVVYDLCKTSGAT